MKSIWKRIMSLVLTLCVALVLVSVPAYAVNTDTDGMYSVYDHMGGDHSFDPATGKCVCGLSYHLWVGGEEVTSEKTNGDGWHYDSATNTLTLDGYSYEGAGHQYDSADDGAYALIYSNGGLNLVLNGENTLTFSGEYYGIRLDGKLTVSGEGSLRISGNGGYGVHCGDFAISSGTLNAANVHVVIHCNRNFAMTGGTLDLDVSECGIYARGSVSISNGTYFGPTISASDGTLTGGTYDYSVGERHSDWIPGDKIVIDNGDETWTIDWDHIPYSENPSYINKGASGHSYICSRCNMEVIEGHDWDAGSCRLCDYQCPHPNDKVEFRDNSDGDSHNGYCAECGEPLDNYVEQLHSYDTTTHICICGKVEEFTVSWSDGDSSPYENSYEFGETIVIPTNELFQDTFRKGGYRLVGWEGYTEGMTMPAEPLIFTAIHAPEAKLVPETPDGENGWYRYAGVCASDGYVVSASEDGVYDTDIQIPDGEYEEIACWVKRDGTIFASEVKLSVPGLKVDGTAPTVVKTEVASLTETTATIRAAVEDKDSGVASVTLILAPTFSGETDAVIGTFADGAVTVTGMQPGSSYRFYLIVKDNAGNQTREEITLTTPDCPSADFSDLEPDAWYHEAADFVLAGGMMQGYGNGTFGPEDTLSRAMVVEILYNLQGRPQVTGTDPYTDTEPGQWYTDAVLWATQEGIALGYGGGKFGPLDPVTREQIAVFFHRYACLTGQPATVRDVSQFPDAEKISDYARTAMGWAVENGLFIGDDTGHLWPVSQATRAEMAIILKRHIAGTE